MDQTTATARARELHPHAYAQDGIKKVIARKREGRRDVLGFGDTYEEALAMAANALERERQKSEEERP